MINLDRDLPLKVKGFGFNERCYYRVVGQKTMDDFVKKSFVMYPSKNIKKYFF